MRTQTLSGLVVLALLSIPAIAQSAGQGSANRLTGADQNFLSKAAQGNMAEVELGRLAEQRASNPAVKQFGQRMVTDHTRLQEQLKSVAAQEGVTLPTSVNAKQQATKDKLSNMSGAAFDRYYINDMVADHRGDISEFQRQADHGTDPAVKQLAQQALPTLHEHLTMAEDVQTQVK
jgi:putative membrane protein